MGPAAGGPPALPEGVRLVRLTPGLIAVVLTGLALYLAGRAASLLLLLFISILIAIYLGAFTDVIEARTKWKRGLSLAAALVATGLVIWGIEALLVPPVVQQTRQLIANLPQYATAWQDWLGRMVIQFPALEPLVGERKQDVIDAAIGQAEGFISGVFPRVFGLLHGMINVASVVVMAIYLARTPEMYTGLVVKLTPPRHRATAQQVLRQLGETLRSWVFAQLFNMFMMGTLTAIGLLILGVPYWLAFGIFTGLVAIVPFFGTLVSTILPSLFVLDQGLSKFVLVILLGVVVHVIEGNVVAPMVFHRGVKLPPVLTIMAVLVVGTVAGPIGLPVAVPLLAVGMVLVRTILNERVYGDPAAQSNDAARKETVTQPGS